MPTEFISKYSNGKRVSAAQYITEIICEKKARMDKKDLHYRFWLSPEWERFYKNQIASAYKLLKQFSDIAIVRGLNNPKASKIYSLRAPHLLPIIEQEQTKLDQENKNLSIKLSRTPTDNIKYGRNTGHNNIISKLKGLDDES